MKKRHVIAIVLVLLFITIPLSAQNYLFQNGQSGFHLKGSFSKIGFPFDEYNTEIGYTINGRLSLDLNYIKWVPNFDDGDIMHFTGGGLNYLLITQDKFPLSVSFGTSYMHSRNIFDIYQYTESDGIIMAQDTLIIHNLDFKSGIHRRFDLKDKLAIIPSIGLGVTKRVFFSALNNDIYVQNPVPLRWVFSFRADMIFDFINVFAGIDYELTGNSSINNSFNFGLGILVKHRTASKK